MSGSRFFTLNLATLTFFVNVPVSGACVLFWFSTLSYFYYSVSFCPIPLWMAARLPDVPPPVSNIQKVVFPHPCLCCPPSLNTFLWLDATFDSISRLCSLDPTVSVPLFFLFRCGFKCVTLEWNTSSAGEDLSPALSVTHILIFLQIFFPEEQKMVSDLSKIRVACCFNAMSYISPLQSEPYPLTTWCMSTCRNGGPESRRWSSTYATKTLPLKAAIRVRTLPLDWQQAASRPLPLSSHWLTVAECFTFPFQ